MQATDTLPKTLTDWKVYLFDKGAEKLGQGVARKAYAVNEDLVVKMPLRPENTRQSDAEIDYWMNSTPEIKDFIAAIVDFGEGWTLMERAACTLDEFMGVKGEDGYYDYDKAEKIREICQQISHAFTAKTGNYLNDLHGGNIGWFPKDMKFKIIDYGLNPNNGKM